MFGLVWFDSVRLVLPSSGAGKLPVEFDANNKLGNIGDILSDMPT